MSDFPKPNSIWLTRQFTWQLHPRATVAALAIWGARADIKNGAVGEVPAHLRDAHYQGASALGHGTGYDYPHDDPRGWVPQQYLPDRTHR